MMVGDYDQSFVRSARFAWFEWVSLVSDSKKKSGEGVLAPRG